MAYYIGDTDDKTEELFADKCVFDLGLGSSMIKALEKMKNDRAQLGDDYFDFMQI